MDSQAMLEILGYAASLMVAVSLMMSSILRLRLLNLAGALAFTVYGVLIGAFPVALVNLLIVFINLYYLRQMLGAREFFRLLRVRPDSEYLGYFLDFHRGDIQRFAPGFAGAPGEGQLTLFVLRDAVPAGVFIGEKRGDGALLVLLDYVTPQFRDLKTGRYLFRKQVEFFHEQGVREILSPPGTPVHAKYLRRMGFAPADPARADGLYRLPIG